MSGVDNIVCGVPQGSVLCPLKLCLYLLPLGAILKYHGIGYHIYADDTQLYNLLPLGAILKYHGIGYHIYADDTQLYILFKCNNPLASLSKLNNCISDIRVGMIKNKLKINYSKTVIYCFQISTGKARFE